MQVTILIILATWVLGSVVLFGFLGLVNRDARLPQQRVSPRKQRARAATPSADTARPLHQ